MEEIIISVTGASGAALVNFLVTKIYNSVTGSQKNFIWKERLLTKAESINDFEELKKRVRIIVIDDEDAFPIRLFQSEGYAVEKWEKVTDVSYGKLESGFYDIIVLDIKGVATDISKEDGLGVLESVKKKNPAQIIIAYSQHSYDLSKVRFWELADDHIAKPSDFLKMKETIDNLITNKFKPIRYIEALHKLLKAHGVNTKELKKLDNTILNVISNKEKPNWKEIFRTINSNADLLKHAVTLGNTILKFF